jgi:hypothetical protein
MLYIPRTIPNRVSPTRSQSMPPDRQPLPLTARQRSLFMVERCQEPSDLQKGPLTAAYQIIQETEEKKNVKRRKLRR